MRSSAWHPSSSLAEVQTRVSADGLEIGAIALYGNATERYNLGIVTEDELAAPPFQQRQIPLLEMCRRYGTPVSVVDAPGLGCHLGRLAPTMQMGDSGQAMSGELADQMEPTHSRGTRCHEHKPYREEDHSAGY